MTKVWLGYEVLYNGCDEFKSLVKVFDSEEKAYMWSEAVTPTDYEWRMYDSAEVE